MAALVRRPWRSPLPGCLRLGSARRLARRRGERRDSEPIVAERASFRDLLADEATPYDHEAHAQILRLGLSGRRSPKAAASRARGEGEGEFIGGGLEGEWPPNDLPEVAIVGQSNCGKSSLLNALMGSVTGVGTAGVSARAGWTAQLNFYRVSADYYGQRRPWFVLVDMPGYGHAVADRAVRQRWRRAISSYLRDRPQLLSLLLLVDCERGLQADDRDFVRRLEARGTHYDVVLTRCDALEPVELARSHALVTAALEEMGSRSAADVPFTSAATGAGVRELWRRLLIGVNEYVHGEPHEAD